MIPIQYNTLSKLELLERQLEMDNPLLVVNENNNIPDSRIEWYRLAGFRIHKTKYLPSEIDMIILDKDYAKIFKMENNNA